MIKSLKINISNIEHMNKKNNYVLITQNKMLLKFIGDLSVNVDDINDKWRVPEKNNDVMSKNVGNNKNRLNELKEE